MCLGVPGQVTEVIPDPLGMPMGKVRFGGVARQVCLAYIPDVEVGEWVLVHVGFALNRLDEEEAQSIFEALSELEKAQELVDREAAARHAERSGTDQSAGEDGAPRG